MTKKLNGFNNGLDTTDGVGDKPGPFEDNLLGKEMPEPKRPIDRMVDKIQQEYEQKFVFYGQIVDHAIAWKDEEMKNLALKRMAGLKLMMDYMPEFKRTLK